MNTKRESYERTKKEGRASRQQDRVLELLQNEGPLCREEIATLANIRISSACARVNELIQERKVSVAGTKWNPHTQRNVETVRANL